MKLLTGASVIFITCSSPLALAVSSWGFNDATISVQTKGAGSGFKEKLIANQPLSQPLELSASGSLKIILSTQDGSNAKRPHQAFLSLSDPKTGLETSFPLTVKESGKAKVELTHKDIPNQLLLSTSPLTASLVIASFGSAKPYNSKAFDLAITFDSGLPAPIAEAPLRYGQLPEIRHIFRADAKSPPVIISLFFTAVVLIALPALLGSWLFLGANINHISKAFGDAPLSHGLFFGAIVAMEGIFYLYYTTWNLFQTLPVAFAIGAIIFLSGSKALTEVQERRLAGLR